MLDDSWHVLHVTANHEKRVVQHLNARSIEHYLPLYTEQSRWTDRTVKLERPLFAGYVFTRFSRQQKLSVVSTPGVRCLLSGSGFHTVSCEELERIRRGLADGYRLRPHPWLDVGTHVRVRGGVFDGVFGVVTELRRQCKVIVSVAAVQQCFSLEVGMEEVELVGAPRREMPGVPSINLFHPLDSRARSAV